MSAAKHARLARLVAAAELPLILAIAPALLFPTPRRLVVLAVMPAIWLCAKIAGGHLVPRTPMNAALWLLLAMVAVSLSATFDIRFSLGKVSSVVLGVLLFWALTRWLTTPDRLKLGTASFLLAGAGLALIGLLGVNWVIKVPALGTVIARLPAAIRGVPGAEQGFHQNAVGGCLILFLPVQVALIATGSHRWLAPAATRWTGIGLVLVQAILLSLTVGAVVLMQSRGAWVALAIASVAVLACHNRLTRLLIVVAAGVVLAVMTAIGPATARGTVNGFAPGLIRGAANRLELWSRGIDGIRDFPLTGMGMNTFRKVMPVRYPTPLVPPDADIAHVHNHLLQAALDLGLPGLIAYTSLWMIAAGLLVQVGRRAPERAHRTIATGLGAGLIAHFMFGMTDAIPLGSKVGVLFWLTLALTVALHRVALAPPSDGSRSRAFNHEGCEGRKLHGSRMLVVGGWVGVTGAVYGAARRTAGVRPRAPAEVERPRPDPGTGRLTAPPRGSGSRSRDTPSARSRRLPAADRGGSSSQETGRGRRR